jgi:uncharacterized protein (TIGR01244 family)
VNVKKPVSPAVTIGDQPTADDLKELKKEGYLGVVNLRHDGEPEQPIGTAEEGQIVRGLGMDYLHYGVGGGPLTEQGVADVCRFLDEHAGGKTLVHCRRGGRAVALVLIHRALRENWPADEAVARGAAEGLTGVDGGLRTIVEEYLRTRPPQTR